MYNPLIHHRRSIRLKGYDYSRAGAYFVTICTQHRKWLFGKVVNGKMILNDAGEMICCWYYELENKYPDIECGEFMCMPNHIHFIAINLGRDKRNDSTDGNLVSMNPTVTADRNLTEPNPIGTETVYRNLNGTNPTESNPFGANPFGANLRVRPVPQTGNRSDSEIPPASESHVVADGKEEGQIRRSAPGGSSFIQPAGFNANGIGATGTNTGNEKYQMFGEHTGSPLFRVVQWFKTMATNEYIRGVKQYGWARFDRKLFQRDYWEHIIRNEQEYNRIKQYIINNPSKWGSDKLQKAEKSPFLNKAVVREPTAEYGNEDWMV